MVVIPQDKRPRHQWRFDMATSQSFNRPQSRSYQQWYCPPNGSWSKQLDLPRSFTADLWTRVSNKTYQFWRTRKKHLPLPNNSFSYTRALDSGWNGYFQRQPNVAPYFSGLRIEGLINMWGYLRIQDPNMLGPSQEELSYVAARNNTKILLKIKDQKINLAQVYAERSQTARLFYETAKNLADCYRALRNGDFGAAARAVGVNASGRRKAAYSRDYAGKQSRAIARGWLSLRYGWDPLLQDIYGAAESLAEFEVGLVRVTAKAKTTTTNRVTTVASAVGVNKSIATTSYTYSESVGITYKITGSQIHTMSSLGITNPALIAWELTPFSFVVDWFLPIGNFISSWDATFGIAFDKGYRTVFQKRYATEFLSPLQPNFHSGAGFRARQDVYCSRMILNQFPPVSLPQFKDPLSLLHVANGLALLTLFRGK